MSIPFLSWETILCCLTVFTLSNLFVPHLYVIQLTHIYVWAVALFLLKSEWHAPSDGSSLKYCHILNTSNPMVHINLVGVKFGPNVIFFLGINFVMVCLDSVLSGLGSPCRKIFFSSADNVGWMRFSSWLSFQLTNPCSLQREFDGIANHFENNPHVRLILKYDEALSHFIYAASDMFIIPSIFEPCGLTQVSVLTYWSL